MKFRPKGSPFGITRLAKHHKMLNQTDLNSFSDLFSVDPWASVDRLTLKLLTLCRRTASFKI